VRSERIPHKRQLIIDEGWALLQYPESGRHLAELCRRARKYNLSLRITSQMVEDFLGTDAGRVILTNASMKFLMKQDPASIDEITRAFHLSEGERKFLLSCSRGEGLFFANQSHVPLRVVASDIEHRLASTTPQELEAREQQAREQQAEQQRQHTLEALAVEQRANEYTIVMPRFYAPAPEEPDTEERREP
jgi:type IV secretory pathway VirB4 component